MGWSHSALELSLPLGVQGTGLGKHSHCKRDVLHQPHCECQASAAGKKQLACIQISFLEVLISLCSDK